MLSRPAPVLDATVYIVDDDASVRDALSWMLRTRRLDNKGFDSAESFLAALSKQANDCPSCVLLDVRMPTMSGLELFNELLARGSCAHMPVIFLTGHADVSTAVDAVKRGAFDFFEKPFFNNRLVDRVEEALLQSRQTVKQDKSTRERDQKLSILTVREQSVMTLVLEGLPNKLIADQLAISVRTVEVHRARIFEKLDVKSAIELANWVRGT